MHLKKVFQTQALLALVIILASCDPTYPVLIANDRIDTVTIIAETTINFQCEDTLLDYEILGGSFDHQLISFKIRPGDNVDCGMVIAGLEGKVPFSMIKIYTQSDSIVANTKGELLNLFDKSFWGDLKKSYRLSIK